MTRLRLVSIFCVLVDVGCGEPITNSRNFSLAEAKTDGSPAAKATRSVVEGRETPKLVAVRDGASAALVALQPGALSAPAAATAVSRKIVYDAQIDLIVDSVDPIAKKVGTLVQDAGGYIAEQNVTGSPGSLRSMRWRVRVPVDQFDTFVDSIVTLGELERNNRTSQDVTEQYYDLAARIKNKRLEEQTLNKILQERTGKLEDVLKIEIELSRVRGEIEQLEGKIRVLENLSSLATLVLNIHERDKYAPPAPVVADFRTQISRVWQGSLLDLRNMGKSLVLWVVSWAIWIPFLLLGAIVAWIVLRWLVRTLKRNRAALVTLARTPITPPRAPTPTD
jgi:hypothetical protein